MKLHSNFIPITVIGFMALGAIGLKDSVRDDFLREERNRSITRVSPWVGFSESLEGVWEELWGSFAAWVVPNPMTPTESAVWRNRKYVTWDKPDGWIPTVYNGATVGYGPGTADSLPAFPGCEGPGCGALQQHRPNGIRVCRVANLNSTGAGSLQACSAIVEADSNTASKPLDITVFDTAGAIYWLPTCASSGCSIWRGWYIMGQSAPGPVVLYNWTFQSQPGSEDLVVRGIAHRGKTGSGSYSYRMQGRRIVSDHISVSHGAQRQVQSYAQGPDYGPFDDSTYMSRYHSWLKIFLSYKTTQYDRTSPVAQAATNFMWNSQPRPAPLLSHLMLHESVLQGVKPCPGCAIGSYSPYRFPNSNSDTSWIHNNLYFLDHAGNQWALAGDGAVIDYTYNEYRAGSGITTSRANPDWYPNATDTICTWITTDTILSLCDWSLFINKNHYDHIHEAQAFYAGTYGDTIASQDSLWGNGVNSPIRPISVYPHEGYDSTTPPITHRRTTPLPYNLPFGFDTVTVNYTNMQTILDSAGAGWRVDSLGAVYMARDTVDRRARASVMDTTAYRMPGDTNRDSFLVDFFPNFSLDVDPKCRDADHGGAGDGMCDAWEELVADTSLEPTAIQASGYSAIELAYAGGITNIDTTFGGPIPSVPADLAFRGAEGYGRNTLAECRDSVYYGGDGVHGNADDWPLKIWLVDGSVRYTPEAALGLRTIVEDSTSSDQLDIIIIKEGGGYHHVYSGSRWLIDKSCVYISALPASGDGAALMYNQGGSGWSFNIYIASDSQNVHDVLIRDLRVWGDSTPSPYSQSNILKVFGGNRLYFDHTSWVGGGDGIEFYGATDTLENVTWGANLSGAVGFTGEPQFSSTNFAADLYDDDPTPGQDKPFKAMSMLRSAFMTSYYRMPLFSSEISKNNPDSMLIHGPIEWINLMSYDAFGNRMSGMYGDDSMDVISSWWGEGSDQSHSNGEIMVRGCYNTSLLCGSTGGEWFATPGIYHSDLGYYKAKVRAWGNDSLFKYTYNNTSTWPLPDSLENASRQGSSNVTGIWGHAGVPDSLWTSSDPRKLVGASRGLTCGGTLYENRDSTDTWFYDRYVNNSVGNTTVTTRGWGSQVFRDSLVYGTPCTDTDADGLPNAFEAWSGITEPDSLIEGYFAIEHYLNGDSAYLSNILLGPPENTNIFPGAFGSGAVALKGGSCSFDSTVVLHVTRTTDSTSTAAGAQVTGSIRQIIGSDNDAITAALEQYPDSTVKYVVFDSAGVFEMNADPLSPQSVECVILAFQTAPGNGAWLAPKSYNRYRDFGVTMFESQSGNSDFVVSHFRGTAGKDTLCSGCGAQSPGTESGTSAQGTVAEFNNTPRLYVTNGIFVGGNDGIMNASMDSASTFARNLLAAVYRPHQAAVLSQGPTQTSRWRNLYIGGHHRQPAFVHTGSDEEHIENLLYDANSKFMRLGRDNEGAPDCTTPNCDSRLDAIGNLYLDGPSGSGVYPVFIDLDNNDPPEGQDKADYDDALRFIDNMFYTGSSLDTFQYQLLRWNDQSGDDCGAVQNCAVSSAEYAALDRGTRLTFFSNIDNPITPTLGQDSASVMDTVTVEAGGPWLLSCDGTRRTPSVNPVRDRYVNWTKNAYTGADIVPDSIAQHDTTNISYGVPTNLGTAATTCTDTDGDGLPDAFETRWGLNPNSSAGLNGRNGDPDGDGYTNMIEYLFPADSTGNDPFTYTNPDGSTGEYTPPGSPGGMTYSGGRYIFLFPLETVDTLVIGDGDTVRVYTADYDSVPKFTSARQWVNALHDSAIVLSCDSLSGAFQDSATADATFIDWGFTGLLPWEVDPPNTCE